MITNSIIDQYVSKDDVILDVLNGHLWADDLMCIAQTKPDYVDTNMMITAYNIAILTTTNMSLRSIDDGSIQMMLVDFEHTIQIANEAKKEGYEINLSPIIHLLEDAYKFAKTDSKNAFILYDYLNKTEQDCNISQDKVDKLKNVSKKYVVKKFNSVKQIARRLRRTERYPQYINHLMEQLEYLEDFKDIINDTDARITQIKKIAFNRGVTYFHDISNNIQNVAPTQSKYYADIAEKNADILGMPVPEKNE